MSMYNRALETSVTEVGRYLRSASRSPLVQQLHYCASTGPVRELEEKLKQHYGVKHAVCVSNATTGLLVTTLAAGVRDSDIVTTPLTYGASIAGAVMLGNRPIFGDVDRSTLTLDPRAARNMITSKTKMLLSVDTFGTPADSRGLRRLADEFNLWYLSDSSQSLGARRDGRPAAVDADALVVSFTAGKTLFAGEGGAILTDNTALYEKLIWFAQHPARQIREVGLNLDNEFALNARISPTAAVWANGMFKAGLARLKTYQRKCFSLIRAVNDSGLTQPITLERQRLEPAFFRIVAVWRGRSRESALLSFLRQRKFNVDITPVPMRLLYRQPAFVAQCFSSAARQNCPIAEHQLDKAFCLSFES